MAIQTTLEFLPDSAPIARTVIYPVTEELQTTIHYVSYPRAAYMPRVVVFDEPTPLLDWAQQSREPVCEVINGGFFLRETGAHLGEMMVAGQPVTYEPFAKHGNHRGILHVDTTGDVVIGPRDILAEELASGDLLQAGPMLVHNGRPTHTTEKCDPELFYETAHQHDEYINSRRYPRTAIASDENYIHAVTVDGRSEHDSGLFLHELAVFLIDHLGAHSAVNLDGGSSATQITGGRLLNTPRSGTEERTGGFPVTSAIEFVPRPIVNPVPTLRLIK